MINFNSFVGVNQLFNQCTEIAKAVPGYKCSSFRLIMLIMDRGNCSELKMHVFRAVSMSVECFHSSKSLYQTPNMLSLVSRLNYLSIAFFYIRYQTTVGKLEKHFLFYPQHSLKCNRSQ